MHGEAALIRVSSSVQDLPVQKQSDLVQDFYTSFAEYFSSEYRSLQHFLDCLFCQHENIKWVFVFIFRFFRGPGHSDNGACGEVDNDTVAQMGFLPWQLWWRTEGPGSSEKDTVRFMYKLPVLHYQNLLLDADWCLFLCSSLNWVSPQMLSVPFPDKKITVTGDPFLPAITGDSIFHSFSSWGKGSQISHMQVCWNAIL